MSRPRWMIVFGEIGKETQFVEHPRHPGKPGWTYDKAEAEAACPPGGRVIDADTFVAEWNQRVRETVSAAAAKTADLQ